MQLEPVEPAHRGLAPSGIGGKDAVLGDADIVGIVADGKRGGVDEANAGTASQLRLQVDGQWQQDARDQRDKARVADHLRKLIITPRQLLSYPAGGHPLKSYQLRLPAPPPSSASALVMVTSGDFG